MRPAPSKTASTSFPIAGTSSRCSVYVLMRSTTAVAVGPPRAIAINTGTCSAESPRRSKFRCALRLCGRIGLVRLGQAPQQAPPPTEWRAGDDAAALGRASYRLASRPRVKTDGPVCFRGVMSADDEHEPDVNGDRKAFVPQASEEPGRSAWWPVTDKLRSYAVARRATWPVGGPSTSGVPRQRG